MYFPHNIFLAFCLQLPISPVRIMLGKKKKKTSNMENKENMGKGFSYAASKTTKLM